MSEPALFDGELAVLRRFTSLSLSQDPRPLDELAEPAQLARAREVYFLFHHDTLIDVTSFLTVHLGRLLHQLACSTEHERTEEHGRVRGRIDWPATMKSRFGDNHDPTRFVCRQIRRRYDTPENQLLRALVETIGRCLCSVPSEVRRGGCYYPFGDNSVQPTAKQLTRLEVAYHRYHNHTRLREVSLPETIATHHLRAARLAKQKEYVLAAHLFRRYQLVVQEESLDELRRLGQTVIPLPAWSYGEDAPWLQLVAAVHRGRES